MWHLVPGAVSILCLRVTFTETWREDARVVMRTKGEKGRACGRGLSALPCVSFRPCLSQWWWLFTAARITMRRPPFSGTTLLQSLWVRSLGLKVSRPWHWCPESLSVSLSAPKGLEKNAVFLRKQNGEHVESRMSRRWKNGQGFNSGPTISSLWPQEISLDLSESSHECLPTSVCNTGRVILQSGVWKIHPQSACHRVSTLWTLFWILGKTMPGVWDSPVSSSGCILYQEVTFS